MDYSYDLPLRWRHVIGHGAFFLLNNFLKWKYNHADLCARVHSLRHSEIEKEITSRVTVARRLIALSKHIEEEETRSRCDIYKYIFCVVVCLLQSKFIFDSQLKVVLLPRAHARLKRHTAATGNKKRFSQRRRAPEKQRLKRTNKASNFLAVVKLARSTLGWSVGLIRICCTSVCSNNNS